MKRTRGEKGSIGSLGMLVGLALLAVLAAMYLREQKATGGAPRNAPNSAIARSRGVACQTQRSQLERDLTIWANDHPGEQATLGALRNGGVSVPSCPEGGDYAISGQRVLCSKH